MNNLLTPPKLVKLWLDIGLISEEEFKNYMLSEEYYFPKFQSCIAEIDELKSQAIVNKKIDRP